MELTIETFDDFIYGRYSTLYVGMQNADGGIKKLTFDDIDMLLQNRSNDAVTISGLQQDTFEYFIEKYATQFKGIRFCNNRLIHDWSALAELSSLEYLELFSSHGMISLWDVSFNLSLKALSISNCSKLHSIKGIEKAPSLKRLDIGEYIWRSTILDSLMPLAKTKIEYLNFTGKKIEDNDLSFLLEMSELNHFDFPTNLFTTEQVAWVVSNFPTLKGYSLCAKIDTTQGHDVPYTLIVGKRKPYLINKGNEAKIQRYIEQFNQLVKYYKGIKNP